jgi:PAS domain S-box-containing protein
VAVRPVDGADVNAGVICSFVDVDERRRARQSLALQAERTRSMLNSVLVGIVTVSDRGIEWMNRSARRMFAGDLGDFLARPISAVATPEAEHPLRRTDWLQRLQEGEAETFECRLRGRDGREFWVVGSAVLTSAGQGSEREVTFALLDIERRRQAEVSIAQAKASLQRVIETAPLAIALFDARSLRVQQLNQTAGEFFGRPLLALADCTLQEMCEPAQASALQGWLRAVAAGQGASEHEWREMPALQGSAPAAGGAPGGNAGSGAASDAAASPHRVWDCRIAPLDEDSGGVTQLLLVASDVTQQREAERARLQAAIDQREVLVREVHHRIKNNLQGVAGLLQQNAARRPELAGVLNEAVGQVQAIAQVHGLQVGGGKPLEMAGLLRAIAQSVQRTFGRTVEVELVGRVPHLLPEAESIPVALTVNELLTNAIKHGQGATVRCTLIGRDEGVCIRVSGQGVLVPGFDLKRVPAGVSGLGLVRALLPRRSASLSLTQQGDDVVADVELRPPSVRWPDNEPRNEHDQRQLEL